jgi:Tfp pilus assembly protein PilX
MNRKSQPRLRARERGLTLVLGLVSLMVVTIFATTMLSAVTNEKTGVTLQIDRTQALKISEGLLQVAENEFLESVSNFRTLATPTAQNDYVVLAGQHDNGAVGGSWRVSRALDTTGGGETMAASAVVTDATGLNTLVTPYVLTAEVRSGGAVVTMRKHIELQQVPIFQFLSFYGNDLEILPGPDMTLSGRVHTNENLYLGAGASLTLDTKYVKTAGKLCRRRKDDNSVPAGWIKIKHKTTNALTLLQSKANLQALGINSSYGMDSTFTGWEVNGDNLFNGVGEMPPFAVQAATQFGGTLGTGDMGVSRLQHPNIGALDAFVAAPTGGDYVESSPGVFVATTPGQGTHQKGYYHANAGLVIRDNQVFNAAGTNITALMPSGFLATKTMWDQRENKTVTLTQLNLNKLKDMDGNTSTVDPSPYFPANGLLYATRSDSTAATGSGIVLSGGSELNAGLTVVSPSPVYIHGAFNTTNKKSAAVITDACHLLSSAWNWTNSSSSGLKTANSTTYNVAILAGNKNTSGSQYSGGFENFPRFHENWTGKTCTIKGSFVCTGTSKIHTGNWFYGGNHYQAPTRNWSYESNFDSPTGLPPFTPTANSTRSVAWEVNQ